MCPDCDHIIQNGIFMSDDVHSKANLIGGQELPRVTDTDHCIRPTCIRRYILSFHLYPANSSAHKKLVWKPTDAELYVILQAIGWVIFLSFAH
jgi:hypothetical protein